MGEGPLRVSLISGCHGDEPVAPAWLSDLANALESDPAHPWRRRATFRIVPHANPDAAARNQVWWREGAGAADLPAYLIHRVRELPGDDLEFGFPGGPDGDDGIRPEARAIADFLAPAGPYHLHGSLHGLGFGGGPWHLVERGWASRIEPFHHACLEACRAEGLEPHDVDRGGEKGFHRLGLGLCSRPDSVSMRGHFLLANDPATAALFRPSSMEFVRALGGDPFTFVTEVPLFLTPDPAHPDWKARLAAWTRRLREAERADRCSEESARVEREASEAGLRAIPLDVQRRLIGAQVGAALDLVESLGRVRISG